MLVLACKCGALKPWAPRAQGAAEIVLRSCTGVMTPEGGAVPLSEEAREGLAGCVTHMASQGLRTLCLSFRDIDTSAGEAQPPAQGGQRPRPADEGLTACCIVGIMVGSHTGAWDLHPCRLLPPGLTIPSLGATHCVIVRCCSQLSCTSCTGASLIHG